MRRDEEGQSDRMDLTQKQEDGEVSYELKSVLEEIAQLSQKVTDLQQSNAYQLGSIFENSFASLHDVLATPVRLIRFLMAKRSESRATQELMEPLRTGSPDALEGGLSTERDLLNLSGRDLRVLFLATNGAGLGHLTRSLAIARRLKGLVSVKDVVFLTTSRALELVQSEGFNCYHIPPLASVKGVYSANAWNQMLQRVLEALLTAHRSNLVILDGTFPYRGFRAAVRDQKHVRLAWIRRQLFKAGVVQRLRKLESLFDLIVIAGEGDIVQATVDASARPSRCATSPIVFLDQEEVLNRQEACKALGLKAGDRNVLVQLGAGNINEIRSVERLLVDLLTHEFQSKVVVAESLVRRDRRITQGEHQNVSIYPISQYFRAFDLVISAAGYNSVNELIYLGAPGLLIPNTLTVSDDQTVRAGLAARFGLRSWTPDRGIEVLSRELEGLLRAVDPWRSVHSPPPFPNGADTVVDLLVRKPAGTSAIK